jgi:hypothetical protein
MLSIDLARSLQSAGLTWDPVRGDRFVVPDRDMDDDVFVVSDFTVEVQKVPSGLVFGFNGTTEWALDSLKVSQVLWLPREEQLRVRLGTAFRRLESTSHGWAVVVAVLGEDGVDESRHEDADVECAYARAVLALEGPDE